VEGVTTARQPSLGPVERISGAVEGIRARQPSLGPVEGASRAAAETRASPTMPDHGQPARTYPQLAQPGQHARNALTVLGMARENTGHEVARHHVAV
jgi:hypothetical protein